MVVRRLRCVKTIKTLKVYRTLVLVLCIYVTYYSIIVLMVQNYDVEDFEVYVTDDRAQWMSSLTGDATLVPITWLAIPGKLIQWERIGKINNRCDLVIHRDWSESHFQTLDGEGSHNSGSNNLQPILGVVPNQSVAVKILNYALHGGSVIKHWSETQHLSIIEQLIAGIRYFDMRVAFHQTNQEFRFVHGLYGDLVLNTLQLVRQFLEKNHREVVILDFNRFYDFCDTEHSLLLTAIHGIFGQMLIPAPTSNQTELRGIDLITLWQTPQRVIVLYHDDASIKLYPNVWSRAFREHAYAAAFDETLLLKTLQEIYASKNLSKHHGLHVWQGISTPDPLDILSRPFSGLFPIGSQTTKAFTHWLKDKVPGPAGIAICSADFVEKYDFIATVINLNKQIQKV